MTTITPRNGTMDTDIINEMERDVYGITPYLRPNDIVIDIGAYIGAFAMYVK